MKLSKEEVIGNGAEEGSEVANKKGSLYDQAQLALEKADSAELFALYEKMILENNRLVDGMALLVHHYSGDKNQPRYEPPSNAIEAMKVVSLAAVQLARDVALNGKK